ncbi:MAG: hypothetical protein PGN07_01985 [Aeromicrobium erythreum]
MTTASRTGAWRYVIPARQLPETVTQVLRSVGLAPRPGTEQGVEVVEPVSPAAASVVDRMLTVVGIRDVTKVRTIQRTLDGPATVFLDFDDTDWPSPCPWCRGWHAERTRDLRGDRVLREWHHAECPRYLEWA